MKKIILAIETSTDICSVSLHKNGELLDIKENSLRKHSTLLASFVDEIFKNSKLKISSIDGIALSIGPGSYTGLRIGLSFTKGVSFSLNKPIIPINTIESLNYEINDINYLVIIHAYKDYFFVQEYKEGKKNKETRFETMNEIKNSNKKIYGYFPDHLDESIIKIKPCSSKIAKVAYNHYDEYISYNIKSIKPNYIKPIVFKTKI